MNAFRSRLCRVLPLLAVLLLIAGSALAAEAEGHGGNQLKDFLYRVLDFGITFGLLFYFLRKPLKNFLRQRRQKLSDELEQARQLQADAEARYEATRKQLADADARIATLAEEIREDGRRQCAQLEEQARAMAAEIRAEATRGAEREIAAARRQLHETAVELAVELAEARLKQQLAPEDQARLIDDYLRRTGEQE